MSLDLYAVAAATQLAYGFARQSDLHAKLVSVIAGGDEAAIEAAVSAYWQAEQVSA
jgi:hypothetical protein